MDVKIDATVREHNFLKNPIWASNSMDQSGNCFLRNYSSHPHKTSPQLTREFPEETLIFSNIIYENDDHFIPPITETSLFKQVDQLKENIVLLEKRNKELVQQVAFIGAAKAVNVLFNFNYVTLLNLLETNKKLEQILQGTYADEKPNINSITELERNYSKRFSSRSTERSSSSHTCPSVSGDSSLIQLSEASSSSVSFVDETTGLQLVSTLNLQTRTCSNKEERLKIGSEDAVQIAFKVALAYPENEKIEEQFCGFSNEVAMTSKEGCSTVLCVNSLNYLHEVFNKHWGNRLEKKKLIADIVGVFFHCSDAIDLVRKLGDDRYIELLLKPFQTDSFDNYDILCGIALINIMQYKRWRHWTFRLSKKQVEKIITQGLKTWVLGLHAPISYDAKSFSNKLKDIRDESVLVQQLNSWLIANATEIHPERYCALLREVQGVDMLELVGLQFNKQNGHNILDK